MTQVDDYWGTRTVYSKNFKTKNEIIEYLKRRDYQYPFHKKFMKHDEQHTDKIILDYGCGPGNDIINLIISSKAKRIIGIDISDRALGLARQKLALFDTPIAVELIQTTDGSQTIPLEDKSVDFILCSGVLQHVSNPEAVLEEFYRILKVGGMGRIMVYNRNSLWFHVHVADEKQFPRTTDGPDCPIVRAWAPEEFISICKNVGFDVKFLGGYFNRSKENVGMFNRHKSKILADKNVAQEHKDFVSRVEIKDGHCFYNNKLCGIGGVYELYKKEKV